MLVEVLERDDLRLANAAAISRDAGDYAGQILTAANEAFIAGWAQAMWVGVAVMTALAVFVVFRGPGSTTSAESFNETDDSVASLADTHRIR